jgi:hypothetical protein
MRKQHLNRLSSLKWMLCLVYILSTSFHVNAQSDNITLNSNEAYTLDRLDILLQNDSIFALSTVKPLDRMNVTKRIEYIKSLDKTGNLPIQLSRIDDYNIDRYLRNNSTWRTNFIDSSESKKGIFKTFYKGNGHFYSVQDKILSLNIDPVLNLQLGHSNDGSERLYTNTRGVLVSGSIDKKIGFYTYLSDNQENTPVYVQDFVAAHHGLPGEGFFKSYGKSGRAYDYFDFRGGISFNVAKYVHIQYAYDKLFIGNGFRSLFLSDFSNNYLFMRINTRLWKLKYEMIIAQTIQSVPQIQREMKPKNYMSIHHLSFQASKWLNVGLYENIMEQGNYGLQLSYLNPLIFYRATESNLGASGKASIGLDAKVNIAKTFQIYSQFLINEFHIREIVRYNDGAFVNKQAFQIGGKYVNAFTIKNLDLQVEYNVIRPFTYTNYDSLTNFTHYNQPLAHPLGASVKEVIVVARYQPLPKLYIVAKIISYLKGLDSAGVNMGGDIFRSYDTRTRDYGYFIGSGIPVNSAAASLNVSYELFDNAFFDFNATHRTYNVSGLPNSSTLFYSIGFRMNIQRREFNF